MNQAVRQRLGIEDKKPLWVKIAQVKSYAGWDGNDVRKARQYGWIEVKKVPNKRAGRKNEIFYNLYSIPKELIKKQTEATTPVHSITQQ